MMHPLTVLIIDDCLEDRQVYRRYLQQDQEHDYEIIEEESGEAALELCQRFHPDGILLDFLLPDLDGLEFLTKLKQQSQRDISPVVMLTGCGNEAIAVKAMKSGVQDYLVKEQTTGEHLRFTISSAIKHAKLSQQLQQSEEHLRQTQRFIERIAETTPGIVYVYDLVERRNIYINPQITKLLGYSPQTIQALGTELITQLMHPDDFARLSIAFQQFDTVKNGEIIENEYRIRHANGEWRWFSSRDTVFIRKSDGLPCQIVGTSIDITQNKLAETALRQSEERYRYLSNAIPQLVWICNAKGQYHYFNQRWYEFTGQTVEQAMRLGWTEIVHPEDISSVVQGWLVAVRTGEVYEHETRYRRFDSIYRWYLERAIPLKDEQGNIIEWFGTSTDIDERKHLEFEHTRLLELEQVARTEAEGANRAKDEFIAMVSHDLRSPLNAILGWAKLLRSRQMDQATVTSALETIERNAQSQAKLLEDLLNISRILQGKLEIEMTLVNLSTIINAAIQAAYPSAIDKSIRLEFVTDDSIPPMMGDSNRLLQVMSNLISNAIKFTPSAGTVQVRLSSFTERKSRENTQTLTPNFAQITVSDTGIGISPEFLPNVFERYHQGTDKQGGLGLGLAIARHLVELHGGTIQAASPGLGKGATFTIKLPIIHN